MNLAKNLRKYFRRRFWVLSKYIQYEEEIKMKKWTLALLIVTSLILSLLSFCAQPTAEVVQEQKLEKEEVKELDIALVIAAMESDYWGRYVRVGAENAVLDIEEKYGVKVNFEVQGPSAESECEQFTTILEIVISKKPDGIVIGQVCPEGAAGPVAQATEMGIRVNLASLGIDSLRGEQYGSLYECDQPEQGRLAAQAYYDVLVKKGLPLDGTTAIQMSVLVPILEEKKQQFIDTLLSLAPNMTILDAEYNENDINIGISLAQTQLAAYGEELVGFFGECNISGDAIAKVIEESGHADKLVGVAVDSDPAEIEALKNGYLDALIVQTPYEQAYRAVMGIAEFIFKSKDDPDRVNIPGVVVTRENMDDPKYAALLDPTILKRSK